MRNIENRINLKQIGTFILRGTGLCETNLEEQKDFTVIQNNAYYKAEKQIKKYISDEKCIKKIMEELTAYGSFMQNSGFCEGIKTGAKLINEILLK